ncbi:hypothetical protein G7066_04415 [Leucobacter coleopterorum]|uniref:histidine kinase n=1 Tax=Leucobacter coleopterorum TaxID=2714933 RepID=A0ABX6JUW5_9MICO|nr:histidine kinase [Leucobacter coleopterorum]QIM18088.1 hypothetical protein G7066_04415 [Leucobacter coleopterorum]
MGSLFSVDTEAKRRTEVVLACSSGALGVGYVLYRAWDGYETNIALDIMVQLFAALISYWRSRFPAVIAIALIGLSFLSPVVAAVTALHAVGRFVANRWASAALVTVATIAVVPIWWNLFDRSTVLLLAQLLVAVLVPWLVGRTRRSQLEVERAAAQARVAAAEESAREVERARLVREMHDVVAHRLTLLVMGTQVLRTQTSDTELLTGLEDLSAQGRQTLDEMREVLQLTGRQEPADEFSLSTIESLAADARAVGQPVQVSIDVANYPAGFDIAERTAVRLIREALTNAVRHAPGATTTVTVHGDQTALTVTVSNRPAARPLSALTTGGQGLRGMRERVDLLGGTFVAETTSDGGFTVHAELPGRAS